MAKILVIEDEEEVRMVISEVLENEGFETLDAPDGVVGVEMAKEHLPDIIICDIMMPELDGYGVLFQLRNDPHTSTIPFIFLTAKASRQDFREGMNLGADDYLTKPFQIEDLLTAIDIRLEKHAIVSEQMDDLRLNLSLSLPHELRTPLNAIFGFSELLLHLGAENLPEADKILEMIASIHESALHLQRLIENYLLYANLRLMEYEPERREQEMWKSDEVLETKELISAFALYKAENANRQDDLKLDLGELRMQISERALQKIVEEVLDNALKFSDSGTPVHVSTMVDEEGKILTIRDQGRGMTPEQVANIGAYMQFERKLYEQQGAGLGLIIAQMLISLHGGELDIQSEIGQGTTVTMTFRQNY